MATVNTYEICEQQNQRGYREGYKFTGTLRAAKMAATKNQTFHGTWLKICYEDGDIATMKNPSTNKWEDRTPY